MAQQGNGGSGRLVFSRAVIVLHIGIDCDMVCAVVVGTAVRQSTSCTGSRATAPDGTTSAVADSATNHDSTDRISQFLFYHDHCV